MEWISIKDRLPENQSTVLIYGNGYDVQYFEDNGFYDFEIDYEFSVNKTENVTHWMPLPIPPE
jgi:Protein of unknown function (DUF551)